MELRKLDDYLKGAPREKVSLLKLLRGIGLGILGGTAMIHVTSHFRVIAKWTEKEEFDREHPEYEQLVMCITGIAVMMVVPFVYLIFLSHALNDHGIEGLLWLLPVAIPQSVSWILRRFQTTRSDRSP